MIGPRYHDVAKRHKAFGHGGGGAFIDASVVEFHCEKVLVETGRNVGVICRGHEHEVVFSLIELEDVCCVVCECVRVSVCLCVREMLSDTNVNSLHRIVQKKKRRKKELM